MATKCSYYTVAGDAPDDVQYHDIYKSPYFDRDNDKRVMHFDEDFEPDIDTYIRYSIGDIWFEKWDDNISKPITQESIGAFEARLKRYREDTEFWQHWPPREMPGCEMAEDEITACDKALLWMLDNLGMRLVWEGGW